MGRQRKQVISGLMYQIVFRARRDIPLPPLHTMNRIIESSVARAQELYPVILCHDIYMGNHPHIMAIPLDTEDFKCFYGHIQKLLTEAIKRLTGLDSINIWEGAPKVTRIYSLAEFIHEVGYNYANPATADMEDTIERYPGVSSWQAFLGAKPERDSAITKNCPWIRQTMIKRLPARSLNKIQDRYYEKKLLKKAKKKAHSYTLSPYAFAKVFNIPDEELSEIRQRIIDEVRDNEEVAREKRRKANKKVIGRNELQKTPILASHKPKKRGPSLCVIAHESKIRVKLINEFFDFCDRCTEAYEEWKKGNLTVAWPPGAYKPPQPRTVNYPAQLLFH